MVAAMKLKLATTGLSCARLVAGFLFFFTTTTTYANCPIDLAKLTSGTWCEVRNSKLTDVAYKWPPNVTYTRNGVGVSAVISRWSGGAYDTKRDRLLVWGGGHFAYGGNEIYAFDVNARQWQRLTNPSIPPAENAAYAADGGPVSRHTYDILEYVASIDSLCSFGVPAPYSQSGLLKNTDCFNFSNLNWERKADTPAIGFGSYSGYDPLSGHVWMFGNQGGCTLNEWDPVKNLWMQRSKKAACYDATKTAAIDPKRRKLVAIGGGDMHVFELPGSKFAAREHVSTKGATKIINTQNPGFDYDPISDRLVAWSGGPNVYSLDLDNLTWVLLTPSKTNTVIPPAANSNGTYGRFRYIPSKNVFVVVNSIDQNVFFYKIGIDGHSSSPTVPTFQK